MSQAGEAGPTRVVILGGGPAGCAAAYWLSRPEQQGKYQVTLYSQGWRLGGKCASGRSAAHGQRNEEHGLHMLMGCYWNAFATLRACYLDWRALKPDPKNPFQTWIDAFLPQHLVSMMSLDGPGDPPTWSPWDFPFPPMPGEPGDGALVPGSDDSQPPPSDNAMIIRLADLLDTHIPGAAPYKSALSAATTLVRSVFLTESPNIASAQQALVEAADRIHKAMDGGIAGQAHSQTDERLAILADIGVAVSLGYLRDIYEKGPNAWNQLNSVDFRAWLGSSGASAKALASAPIDAFYDLTFAAINGREIGLGQGSLAAGVSLRAQMEIVLGYANAPLFKMAAGMGDTIFTPFWDVLTARGVDIRLFSRALKVIPSVDGKQVAQLVILTQAVTVDGSPYRPFRRVKNLDCWPSHPDWNQLKNGPALKAAPVDFESSYCDVTVGNPTTLTAGQDFDVAILAMPPQVLDRMAPALAKVSPAWDTALSESASVATQSLQLWMTQNLTELGWTHGPTVLTAFVEPYDSWGDMSQTLALEAWPGPNVPASIAYFCGCMGAPLDPPVSPSEMKAVATAAASQWVGANLRTLWPNVGPNPVAAAFSRYDKANFDISDTYVQTPAGANVASRLDPSATAGFSNLYAIGDWTQTRFSGGCFESAVESAMLASRAISGFPPTIKTS
jgi:uncharacterized protein with NAD-binding domain and iron-sulfur cluster